jgi:type I restriction enzyme M protein
VLEDTYISVQEAASLLGITKTTLRSWDKRGKLKAVQNPVNQYRMYHLSEVVALQKQISLFPVETSIIEGAKSLEETRPLTAAELRRLVKALHRILRDSEGNSSLIERFDELTKILYCKVMYERRSVRVAGAFTLSADESDKIVAARVHAVLAQLIKKRPGLFPQRFSRLRLSDTTIRRLVEALAPVKIFSPHEDLKGLAYEEVIKNTFEKGDNQQFFTPRTIVEFMVQMLDWSAPRTVCDPACGTGGFLLFVDRFLKQQKRKPVKLLGFEIDERLAWVAGINLAMHDVSDFDIRCLDGSGFLGPDLRRFSARIDAIITNPPFGSDLNDKEALAAFELGKDRSSRRRGILFIERCLEKLDPGGVLAIIIDEGVLNSPSNTDTRRLILSHSHPFAIVSLPETAFMPYASVKASVLFLQKKKGRKAPAVHERGTFFAQAEVVGRKANGDPLFRVNKATSKMELDSDLPSILQQCRSGSCDGERVFWSRVPDIEDTAFATEGYRLDLAYHHPSRPESLKALQSSPYALRTLLDICDVRTEAVVPSKNLQDEELTYLGLANIEAYTGVCSPVIVSGSSLKSSVKRFVSGDILFAKMRPELRKVCLVPEEIDEGFASAECLVLVPKTDKETRGPMMLPELLSIVLRSDLVYGQIVHLVIGIGRPRLNKMVVLNVRLPCPPLEQQRRLLELYRKSERAAQALMLESQQFVDRARQISLNARKQLVDDLLHPNNHV